MMEIYALRLAGRQEDELVERLLQNLDEQKRERIKRFVKWEDAHRSLFGDLLIRHIVLEKTGLRNRQVSFVTNKFGKPFLKEMDTLHFNLSHSGCWIVCAVDHMSIGIDVEKIAPIDLDISKNFFSREEHGDLLTQDDPEKLSYFFTLWTLKESYIKEVGKGLSIPLDSFTIKAGDRFNIWMKLGDRVENRKFLRLYDIDDSYKMAVCALNGEFPPSVHEKEMDEIIAYFRDGNR